MDQPLRDSLSDAFKALGHPHRLSIVRQLVEQALSCRVPGENETCAPPSDQCDFATLAGELDVSTSTVSHHLKTLRQAGLVECEKEGRQVRCRINRARLRELRAFLTPTTDSNPTSGLASEEEDAAEKARASVPKTSGSEEDVAQA